MVVKLGLGGYQLGGRGLSVCLLKMLEMKTACLSMTSPSYRVTWAGKFHVREASACVEQVLPPPQGMQVGESSRSELLSPDGDSSPSGASLGPISTSWRLFVAGEAHCTGFETEAQSS